MGMTTSGMVTAMMNDASDGILDGMMGDGTMMQANAGTTGLSTAMGTFIGSAMNRSGVTASDMQALMNKLSTSTGKIQ